MLRQLGVPTFFLTNSMADTRWVELLQALSWAVDKKVLSREEVSRLNWEQRTRLVRLDPVTCARSYRMRTEALLKVVKRCPDILGPLEDFFLRDEFQHRGASHSHWLAFIKDAPLFGTDSDSSICDWIDKFITCSIHVDESLKHLIELQIHRHKKACKKGSGKNRRCRFHYPLPPMDETRILYPLSSCQPRIKTCINKMRCESRISYGHCPRPTIQKEIH